MDFEMMRRKKITTVVEVAVIICCLAFISYQVYLYASVRIAKNKADREAMSEMMNHPTPSSDKIDVTPKIIEYEGDAPYASIDLGYGLASLTIQTDDGKAVFTNGKSAGINIDVDPVEDSDGTVTSVGMEKCGSGLISLSGVGQSPSLNVRYAEGYSVRATLDHAIQASFNKDGDVKIYNLELGDKFDVTYAINPDSYKYPGVDKFSITGKATDDGALSIALRGDILTISGVNFEDSMLSVANATSGGSGIPIDGSNGFVTYNFTSKTAATTPQKGGM